MTEDKNGVVGPKHKIALLEDIAEAGVTIYYCQICYDQALTEDLDEFAASVCKKGASE
jgi:hypothetical protein